MIELSQDAVRGAMIAAQGLTQQNKTATKKDVLRAIRQMQVLQIDTIHVVARSPYLVLWSRLGDYNPRWLEEHLAEGNIFEYWSHAACFLPIEDYPLYRRVILDRQIWNGNNWGKWLDDHRDMVNGIMTHIREKGAVRSSDFKRSDDREGGWWNWKDEKIALEGLLMTGELMIRKRHNFQRIYDLRERVMPDWDDARAPSLAEVHQTYVLNTVKALGVTKAAWIADYFRLYKAEALAALKTLMDAGQLETVKVEGWDEPGYVHPEQMNLIKAKKPPLSKTTLLSPFDPMVWDRARAQELFNFTYQIECYTPAPKRIYGYFTLPILYKNQLIGRLDPKAHRKEGIFEVKALHLEPGVVVDDDLIREVKGAIKACAEWHETPQVVVRMATVPELAEAMGD